MRNPYVVLGIPFGASSDVAEAAFARRARGLRRAPNGTERLRDLTWALNQVEEILKEPSLALDVYRVPADPGAFEPDGTGVLRPAPVPMRRRTVTTDELDTLLDEAAAETLTALRHEVSATAQIPAP